MHKLFISYSLFPNRSIKKPLTIRIPEGELAILKTYCEQESRTQTDIFRDYIRSLKGKIVHCDSPTTNLRYSGW